MKSILEHEVAEQVAIITGAGGGIGRATADMLARTGFDVVLVGRTERTLLETQKLVGGGLIVVADVSKPQDAERIVEQAIAKLGRIDVLVNNAGVAPVLPVEQTTPQIWREVIDTNLSSAFYLSRACWETFKRQHSGVIVNISSVAAKDPFPGFIAYGAAKAGLNNLGISLAREGSAIGVRVYTIAPGAVETAMFRAILSPEQFPVDNTLRPQEVAQVVADCIAGDARYKSGEVIWISRN